MPRWSDIKIGQRILLGFGFAAFLTLLVAAVSIYYLRGVGQGLTSIAEQDQLLLTNALELQVVVEQESDGVRGYLLSGEQSFLEPFITGQSHYSEAAMELEGLVESQENRRLLSDINTLHNEFLKIAEEEITLHEQGFPQSAIFLWQKQGNEIKGDLHAKLTGFIDQQEGVISQHAQEAQSQQNQALVIALILVVVAWVAGMAGGIWISRSITRPIRSLVSATQAISKGDLTTRTSLSGTDELAALGGAMNQMVRDLAQSRETTEHLTAQLRDLVGTLEQRVAERTHELEKLEELGRAIIDAPPDASTLPDVLSEHVPGMFPRSHVEIRIFPDNTILRHPDDDPPVDPAIWEWLRSAPEGCHFAPGSALPGNCEPVQGGVILTPVVDGENGDTIGGVFLSRQWQPGAVASLLPAVQSLAAQVASALRSARDYEQLLAHHRMTQELATAWQIQASFLPEHLPEIPGWQVAATLKPARETSGDFYDFVVLPDEQLGILIADVADKGVGAALYMALSRTLIRTYGAEHYPRPDLALEAVNRRLLRDVSYNMFVTVFYGILNPKTGVLTYCNAGHDPPYLFSARNGGETQALRRTGVVLGLFDDLTWEQESVQLGPGDALLLYTDGITDAQNAQGTFFGDGKWLETVHVNLGRSAQEIQDALVADIHRFVGNAPPFDDIAMMVIVRSTAG